MRIRVKSKRRLLNDMEDFISEYKDTFEENGFWSEKSFRKCEESRIEDIAGKDLCVEKVEHTNEGYHYVYPWFKEDGKQYYGIVNPEDVE